MKIYKEKKEYNSPEIHCIKLDNEISLALASDNDPSEEPDGPLWSQNQNGMQSDPFNNQMG